MPRRALAFLLLGVLPLGCGTSPPAFVGDPDLSVAGGQADAGREADLAATSAADLAGAVDLSSPADLVAAPDLAPSAYPAGPYGSAVGAVIPNLVWQGYDNPAADAVSTTKPFGAYSMDALRLGGKRYAVVHVSEFS